ncbi:chemotaxis protein CheW [Vulgatibacter incomptus]|uniref:CheW domain protein n=1 Tax=Vulgatibacter incomptus TaxID=1391653 RepID=A0A0K1PFW1_9BACT|nr:chemotaxis protein CheW [Vulgatibacter incomptus]AKU92405.1 CheW domain protein [Vulgatibacter incomptus]
MIASSASAPELLVFEVDGRRHAARVERIRRIAQRPRLADHGWIDDTALGEVRVGQHGLVVEHEAGERTLSVDRVVGLRKVVAGSIHPLPGLAAALMGTEGIGGLVDVDEELILLVDVPELLRKEP